MNNNIFLYSLLIFLILLSFKIYNIYKLRTLETISIEKLYDDCKTGDIIYFRWNSLNPLHEIFSKYTHMGMIVIMDNEKYIFENNPRKVAKMLGIDKSGAHLHNLQDRIDNYEGNIYYSNLNVKIEPNVLSEFYNNIEKYKNINFKKNFSSYIFNYCVMNKIFGSKNCNNQDDKEKICSEFVLHCLFDLKVIEKGCNCIFPEDFDYMKKEEKIFDTPKNVDRGCIDNCVIDYIDINYFLIHFFVLLGGVFGFLLNNLHLIRFHIVFNIVFLVNLLINERKYNNEKDIKMIEDLEFIFKTDDPMYQYYIIIISTIISILFLYKSNALYIYFVKTL